MSAVGTVTLAVHPPRNGNYKVTPADHAEIRRRLAAGEYGKVIAADFGLSGATVSRIKRGVR